MKVKSEILRILLDFYKKHGQNNFMKADNLTTILSIDVTDFLNPLQELVNENLILAIDEGKSGTSLAVGCNPIKINEIENIIMNSQPNKIFLSHKSSDKKMVREFKSILFDLGFKPWLDEDAMSAGDELERAILKGFQDSCAAIFFITPSFKDENFLATEINYAISEKRNKNKKFVIITIVFQDDNNNSCIVPDLLKSYVWKNPKSNIEALKEILKALPIRVGEILWKN